MPTYYRVQPAHRDPAALVGGHHVSRPWQGADMIVCPACRGCDDECLRCLGRGEVELSRRGVSVCESIEDLRHYFAGRLGSVEQIDGDVVVVLEGDRSDDEDLDADHPGAPVLVHPTRIVEVLADAVAVLGLR